MPAIFQNFLSGTLTADPGAGGATLTSAELTSMTTVASPDYMWVTLDPAGVNGAPEIVKVTTHAGAGGTAAITRAQQSTTARAHPVGTVWRHGPTSEDAKGSTRLIGLAASRPAASALVEGYRYYSYDTDTESLCDGTGWVIMSEPVQTYTPTVTASSGSITTIATRDFRYTRHDGWLHWVLQISITTNGTGAGQLVSTVPIAFDSAVPYVDHGHGRENGVSGSTLQVFASGVNFAIVTYNNAYPGANGAVILCQGRYRMTTRYS